MLIRNTSKFAVAVAGQVLNPRYIDEGGNAVEGGTALVHNDTEELEPAYFELGYLAVEDRKAPEPDERPMRLRSPAVESHPDRMAEV